MPGSRQLPAALDSRGIITHLPSAGAVGLLRSSEHHSGSARHDRRRKALQWTMGLPVCPMVLSTILDLADVAAANAGHDIDPGHSSRPTTPASSSKTQTNLVVRAVAELEGRG